MDFIKAAPFLKRLIFNSKTLVKICVYWILKYFNVSKYEKRYIRVSNQWRYRSSQKRFIARTMFEKSHIIDEILLRDEYHLSKEKFEPNDVIIDIGAHIGIFSYLCHYKGSRNINSYEPDKENAHLFNSFLGDLKGVQLSTRAVFRSDIDPTYNLLLSGYQDKNTGAGNVLFTDHIIKYKSRKTIKVPPAFFSEVNIIPLDHILAKFEHVKLLKLDCEGSEFPILLTSELLSKVDRIIGEYHEVDSLEMKDLAPIAKLPFHKDYKAQMLVQKLEENGFEVTLTHNSPGMGHFDAWQKRDD